MAKGSHQIDLDRHGQFDVRGDYHCVAARYELNSGIKFKIELESHSIKLSLSETSSGNTTNEVSISPEEFWELVKDLGDRIKLSDRRNAQV